MLNTPEKNHYSEQEIGLSQTPRRSELFYRNIYITALRNLTVYKIRETYFKEMCTEVLLRINYTSHRCLQTYRCQYFVSLICCRYQSVENVGPCLPSTRPLLLCLKVLRENYFFAGGQETICSRLQAYI